MEYCTLTIFLLAILNCVLCEGSVEPDKTEDTQVNFYDFGLANYDVGNNFRVSYNNDYYGRSRGVIERPCPVYDIYCIRRFFASHATCKISRGPVPDPVYRAQATVYFSSVNLTATGVNLEYRGLNGRIDEFYLNRETNNVILAVEFRNLHIRSNYTYFRFHRRGKEPIVTEGRLEAFVPLSVSTVIIPQIDNMQLQRAEVSTHALASYPLYLDPTIFASTDPTVARTAAEYNTLGSARERQAFLTESAFYVAKYIQHNICDFGLEIL